MHLKKKKMYDELKGVRCLLLGKNKKQQRHEQTGYLFITAAVLEESNLDLKI